MLRAKLKYTCNYLKQKWPKHTTEKTDYEDEYDFYKKLTSKITENLG